MMPMPKVSYRFCRVAHNVCSLLPLHTALPVPRQPVHLPPLVPSSTANLQRQKLKG